MNKTSMHTDHCISNEPDDSMQNYIYTVPSDKIYFQGRRDGIDIGEERNRIETASRMLASGKLSIQDIAAYSGLSKEEVEKLK